MRGSINNSRAARQVILPIGAETQNRTARRSGTPCGFMVQASDRTESASNSAWDGTACGGTMRVREARDSPFKHLNQKSELKIKNRAAVVCNSGALQLGAECLALLRLGQPCQPAARADLRRERDQPPRTALRREVLLGLQSRGGGGEGENQRGPARPSHGLTIRSAPVMASTMEYIFVTPPTASFSVKP